MLFRSCSKAVLASFIIIATACSGTSFAETKHQTFTTVSRDGTNINGVIDLPEVDPSGTVILVPGTGLYDRDLVFGKPGTPGGKLFEHLSNALTSHGLAVVRYDMRGALHHETGAMTANRALAATATVENKIDDVRTVYDWALSASQPDHRCVVLLGFSEGMRYVAGLAESHASAPVLVVGLGAVMRSPVAVMRWQKAGRFETALRNMDSNGDGTVSEAELATGWPKSWMFSVEPNVRRIKGPVTEIRLSMLSKFAEKSYNLARDQALAMNDDAAFPDKENAAASAKWWKSWFNDQRSVADRLAVWDVPVSLHYGERDSQLAPQLEIEAARSRLGERVTTRIHPALGHALGDNALYGPMDAGAEKILVDDIASAAQQCQMR